MPKPDRMTPARVFARALLLLLLCLAWPLTAAAQAGDVPRIGVATMQPGDVFFERFGHNALVVDDPDAPYPMSYNFGAFDPNEADFVPRFIRGDMRYQLMALPLADDLAYYRDVGRGVSIQWLDLTPTQARSLAAALVENAKPENAHYRYDYFTDNCSTRVRDAIDTALGGALRNQLQGRSRGNTYRGDAVRLASPAPWMWLGFDIGLGPAADRPNALWDDAFVPMRLAEALRGVRNTEGRPLVSGEQVIVPHNNRYYVFTVYELKRSEWSGDAQRTFLKRPLNDTRATPASTTASARTCRLERTHGSQANQPWSARWRQPRATSRTPAMHRPAATSPGKSAGPTGWPGIFG